MIEKEYYRLEDLKHRFNMTDADIKYLLEEQKIPLCFYVERQPFVLGFFNHENFTGHCNIYYKGLVKVPYGYTRDLCNGREICPKEYLLLQQRNIEYINSKYAYELEMPNEYFKSWHPLREDNLPEFSPDDLEAKLYPWYRKRPQWDLGMILTTGINVYEVSKGRAPTYGEEFVKDKLQIKEMGLYPDWLYFKFGDICVPHNSLVKLGLIQAPAAILEQSDNVQVHSITEAAPLPEQFQLNKFEELLTRVLKTNKHLSSKLVHKILCSECELEEDSRQYDIENILLDVVGDVIVWHDYYSKKKQKSCSFRHLENTLTKIRRALS